MLTVYNASAGSGKTHTLVENYLQLALGEGKKDKFKGILAITFSIKAAKELKDRVLNTLTAIETGELPAPFYTDKNNVTDTLLNILYKYDTFNISTLDSFFLKVIKAFTYEANLRENYTLILDTDEILSEALERVYKKAGTYKFIKSVFTKIGLERLSEGSSWDSRLLLKEFAKDIFSEAYKDINLKNRDLEETENTIFAYDSIYQKQYELKQIAKRYAQQLKELLSYHNLPVSEKLKNILSSIDKFPNFTDATLRQLEIVNLEELFNKADQKKYQTEISSASSEMHKVFSEVLTFYFTSKQKSNTYTLLLEKMLYSELFKVIAEEIQQIKAEQNIFLISDQSLFLEQITKNTDVPFIFDKLGTNISHFFIDETQDTSNRQWKAILPLLQNGLATNQSSLLVGDVKQAIYRWRGGDWSLLLQGVEADIGTRNVTRKDLTDNYRSLGNIIGFNNDIFAKLPKILSSTILQDDDALNLFNERPDILFFIEGETSLINKAFLNATQFLPSTKSQISNLGYVKLELTSNKANHNITDENGSTDEVNETQINTLIKWIEDCYKLGYTPGDIAILVRSNSETQKVADILQKQTAEANNTLSLPFSSPGSLLITNAKKVRLLIAIIKLTLSPSDLLIKEEIANEIASIINVDEKDNQSTLKDNTRYKIETLLATMYKLIPIMQALPIYELAEYIIENLTILNEHKEDAYIYTLLSDIQRYQNNVSSDTAAFIEYWDTKGYNLKVNQADDGSSIKIMTIHKCKGLQFPIVMMPFTNWSLLPKSSNYIWENVSKKYGDIDWAAIATKRMALESDFAKSYIKEVIASYLDNLNLLYVAFTRAERMLYVAGYLQKRADTINTVNCLLIEYLWQNELIDQNQLIDTEKPYIFSYGQPIKAENYDKFQ